MPRPRHRVPDGTIGATRPYRATRPLVGSALVVAAHAAFVHRAILAPASHPFLSTTGDTLTPRAIAVASTWGRYWLGGVLPLGPSFEVGFDAAAWYRPDHLALAALAAASLGAAVLAARRAPTYRLALLWAPVALLPALLSAWAFATFLQRGFELGKRRTKCAAPLLLGVLFLATALQSWNYCALFVRPEADTRTQAGEWIAENIPDGATIGVVSEPWQFELPPLNGGRFKIVIVAQDPEALAKAAPDYFVTSDLQFPPVAVRGPLTTDERQFRAEVFEGGSAYKVRKHFEAWPYSQALALRHGPHDMRYANPVIVVAQRATVAKGRISPDAGGLLASCCLDPARQVGVITSSQDDSIVFTGPGGGLP